MANTATLARSVVFKKKISKIERSFPRYVIDAKTPPLLVFNDTGRAKEQTFREKNKKNITVGRSLKGYGRTYRAARAFKKGEVVMHCYGKVIDHQTKHISIQIGSRRHILPGKWGGKYLNHSCEPNTHVRTEADGHPVLVAHRPIKTGEEITFAYYMTEYAWASYTDETYVSCKCGSKKCAGKILSFSQLSPAKQKKLVRSGVVSAYLADYVSGK